MSIVTNILVLFIFIVGGICLQIFLSKRQSKWLGLILPAITLLYSLIMVLNIATFNSMTAGEVFTMVAITFLLSNIPTIILLGIYLGCREKIKKHSQLNKMNIQDLN